MLSVSFPTSMMYPRKKIKTSLGKSSGSVQVPNGKTQITSSKMCRQCAPLCVGGVVYEDNNGASNLFAFKSGEEENDNHL